MADSPIRSNNIALQSINVIFAAAARAWLRLLGKTFVPPKPDEFHNVVENQSTAGNEGYGADQNAGIVNAKGNVGARRRKTNNNHSHL